MSNWSNVVIENVDWIIFMLVYIYDLHLILCIVVGDGNVNFSVVKLLLLMLIQFIRIFPIIVYYAYE